MEALAVVSTFSSSSLSSTAPRPHHRLLTSPASGRSSRTLLPPPRAVSSSRAPLVVSHTPPAPVAAAHAKVGHSGRFCRPPHDPRARAPQQWPLIISVHCLLPDCSDACFIPVVEQVIFAAARLM